MASSNSSPNVLLIMTDQERYPPPYEDEALAKFRREQLGARGSLRKGGLEFHRHYAGSTACTPSRATLFTGQYPSLHGVSQTDGTAKQNDDPAMMWLDPDAVPTLGDWFRAGGCCANRRDIVAITAAMPGPTGLTAFGKRFPDRLFDVGIAEQHAMTSAAGLAMGGLHPVVAIYSTFLNRAFDQIMMDVALHNCR